MTTGQYVVQQHNRVWIGVKSLERVKGKPKLELVWVKDLASAATFSSKKNAEDFIREQDLLSAKSKNIKTENAAKLST